MDDFRQIGKYIKTAANKADKALKRPVIPQVSYERIRDIFDSEDSFKASVTTPDSAKRITLDVNFTPKLPVLGCCADCLCGTTESYTSDSLVSGSIYTQVPYVSLSTVVYLDGIKAIRNSDYVESNPGTGQLAVLQNFNIITISYVYTVGNCSDGSCPEDTAPCLEFKLFSGLLRAFADRFDVPKARAGETVGGCGSWVSGFDSSGNPTGYSSISTYPAGYAYVNSFAALGGPGRLIGKSVEVVLAIRGESTVQISLGGWDRSVQFNVSYTSTTMTLSMTGYAKSREFENAGQIVKSQTFSRTPDSKFVRIGQYPTGTWIMRVWDQGAAETTARELVATVADINTVLSPSTYTDVRAWTPTIYYVEVFVPALESILIGGGMDSGDYARYGTVGGYFLSVCRQHPVYGPHPYSGGCDNEIITVSATSDSMASYHFGVAFPVIIGSEPPGGTGRIVDVSQRIGTIRGLNGKPTGIRIKGQVRVTGAYETTTSVVFESYGGGSNQPTYSNARFLGGSAVGSALVSINGPWVDFEFMLTGSNTNYRWGAVVPNIDQFAASLPFIPGSFMFPPTHGFDIGLRNIEIEAFASAICNAGDVCGLCVDDRCPEIQDSFDGVSYTDFATPSSKTFSRVAASGSFMEVAQDDGTTFTGMGGGVGRISFTSLETSGSSSVYLRYPVSPFECRTSDSNVTASFEFKINTLSPAGGYADIYFGGYYVGPYAAVQIYSPSNITFTIFPASSPALSLSANVWYTAEYETDGNTLRVRIYASGSTPSAWNSYELFDTETLGSYVETFYISGGYQFDANTPNVDIDIKNVSIRSV